ncbi:MAG: TatD family hydrolase [Chloroflexi bacterium]|nr:TatD family hydrolase [Chloroflexota bacterium]
MSARAWRRPVWVDSHCHLDDRSFTDLDAVIERARQAGVGMMVATAEDLPGCARTLAIAERYPEVYAAVGIHPNKAGAATPGDLAALRELARHPKVVAIGETGLDFYRDWAPVDAQEHTFRAQLELAAELRLPVVVHQRRALEQASDILEPWARARRARGEAPPFGVMHCFSGDAVAAQRCLDLGFLISLAGPVTFPRAERTRVVAGSVPLWGLVLETDAPVLAPQGRRGRRNEPAYLVEAATVVAAVRGISLDELARATTANALGIFRLSAVAAGS